MSVRATVDIGYCQITLPRGLDLENLHRLGITAFAYSPLQLASPHAASHIIEKLSAYVEEKKRSGSMPPGLAEQWDIQLRILQDSTLPDMEIIGYPGFFKVALSCGSFMYK